MTPNKENRDKWWIIYCRQSFIPPPTLFFFSFSSRQWKFKVGTKLFFPERKEKRLVGPRFVVVQFFRFCALFQAFFRSISSFLFFVCVCNCNCNWLKHGHWPAPIFMCKPNSSNGVMQSLSTSVVQFFFCIFFCLLFGKGSPAWNDISPVGLAIIAGIDRSDNYNSHLVVLKKLCDAH